MKSRLRWIGRWRYAETPHVYYRVLVRHGRKRMAGVLKRLAKQAAVVSAELE